MIEDGSLAALIAEHGLLILALLCLIEGPAATLAGGWLASMGLLPLGAVMVVAVLGEIVGDLLHYLAGRLVVPGLPAPWRSRLGLSDDRMQRLTAHFDRYGGATIVLAKVTHALGAVILLAAGAARMHPARFVLWAMAAGVPKVILLTGLGWHLGLTLSMDAGRIWPWALMTGALLLALAMGAMWRKGGGTL